MGSIEISIIILGVLACALSLMMLMAKTPIGAALNLLGILLCTAGVYGLWGEHFIATIQLVVYAGAIMVLFVFSIMLLSLKDEEKEFRFKSFRTILVVGLGLGLFALIQVFLVRHQSVQHLIRPAGSEGFLSHQKILELGGNTKVLSHALFSQFYLSFEVVSLALLVALVGAVVLAKRKL